MQRALRSVRHFGVRALFLVSPLGCGGQDPDVAAQAGDAAMASAPLDAGGCAPLRCACPVGVGMQLCSASGQLGACECGGSVATPPDAAIVTVGICPTGSYAGNFKGEAGFLIAIGEVNGLDLFDDKPPLQILLGAPVGDEFVVVGDGVMHGTANAAFPFEAKIHGKLDCTTKRFTGTLSGSVQLVLEGINNDFTGTMEATYDTDKHAFVNGKWTVTGSEADGGSDFGLTGNGDWNAEHVADGGVDAGR